MSIQVPSPTRHCDRAPIRRAGARFFFALIALLAGFSSNKERPATGEKRGLEKVQVGETGSDGRKRLQENAFMGRL
jgi:hypothetical protein